MRTPTLCLSPTPPAALAALLVLLPLLILPGCRGREPRGDPGLRLELAISPTPPGVGPARLLVFLADTAGTPLPGARVEVEGHMSHAGMVPVLAQGVEEGEGRYTVPDFGFTMAGDWVLTVQATLPDGRRSERAFPTRVVSAPRGAPEGSGR